MFLEPIINQLFVPSTNSGYPFQAMGVYERKCRPYTPPCPSGVPRVNGRQERPICVFRPSATVSRISLMESCTCHRGEPPPLAGCPPPKLHVMKWAALWSCVCVVIVEDPPWLVDQPWLADPPRDGWLGRSTFALTKRTCCK